MFRRLGKTLTTVISKKSQPPQNTRSFSTSSVKSITNPLRSEVNSLKSEINFLSSEVISAISDLRTDIAAVKVDIAELKTDIAELKTDLTNFKVGTTNQFNKIHKQATINVRIILAGMFGVGAASVTANQFIMAKLDSKHDDIVSPALTIKKS